MKTRVKRSFTLIELIIVIILISTIYFVSFSNSMFFVKKDTNSLNLGNVKEFLLENYDFENNLSIKCIEEDFECFIFVDSILQEDIKINKLFVNVPEIYEFNKNENRIFFKTKRINDIEYDIIFEIIINDDFTSNEFILDTLENKVYVFNSLFRKVKVYESLNEVFDNFSKKEDEVKDAF